jgi:hypothetical protein
VRGRPRPKKAQPPAQGGGDSKEIRKMTLIFPFYLFFKDFRIKLNNAVILIQEGK